MSVVSQFEICSLSEAEGFFLSSLYVFSNSLRQASFDKLRTGVDTFRCLLLSSLRKRGSSVVFFAKKRQSNDPGSSMKDVEDDRKGPCCGKENSN